MAFHQLIGYGRKDMHPILCTQQAYEIASSVLRGDGKDVGDANITDNTSRDYEDVD
jgi:hypothetical protein